MCHVETFEQIKMNRWMDGDSDSSRYMVPGICSSRGESTTAKVGFYCGKDWLEQRFSTGVPWNLRVPPRVPPVVVKAAGLPVLSKKN